MSKRSNEVNGENGSTFDRLSEFDAAPAGGRLEGEREIPFSLAREARPRRIGKSFEIRIR
jgi:hypothetical protein